MSTNDDKLRFNSEAEFYHFLVETVDKKVEENQTANDAFVDFDELDISPGVFE